MILGTSKFSLWQVGQWKEKMPTTKKVSPKRPIRTQNIPWLTTKIQNLVGLYVVLKLGAGGPLPRIPVITRIIIFFGSGISN